MSKLELVGRLAGGLVHDFNNLLTVIGTAAHNARELTDEATGRDLREVEEAVARAARVLRDLRTFSRSEVGGLQLLDLSQAVLRAAPLLRRLVGERATLVIDTSPHPVGVRVVEAQLERVLTNLVINAVNAMDAPGTITVHTHADTDTAWLTVTDDGQGMDAATAARCFEPFFTTSETGTGLGLATVFGLATQWGGALDVESKPGAGTTITLRLPLVTLVPEDEPSITAQPAEAPRGSSVLLVDDEPLLRRVLRRSLEQAGFTVAVAVDAESALAHLEQHGPPTLLVTDVIMPGTSGVELARAVRRRWPATAVLLMTGYAPDEVVGHELGRFDVITKPFSSGELVRQASALLDPEDSSP